ncbi:MAG TPA: cytochrome c-type biogenesis CcmF C-terminal domain-containing protein, partial [Polyangiaceae bacterium]|nr:cytochrome c-type biogenesis CcmF C-terminal domain-containing protein [Polyangiaceae bacterium]
IPFAFAIAALVTGRLDNEWIVASRKWMLFSWLFLSIGNALGMLWAYEELGWGGYWAWDPVENAAFLPWLTASAYVHSVMIQERRSMLKMWNVILICLTFFLTYFGTFLTRSGLIASVHSFAQSGIGTWFAGYMVVIAIACAVLIVWRRHNLQSLGQFDSVLSREIAFLLNNWILLTLLVFIVGATVYPRLSEWLLGQSATVGPPFYNTFIPPVALVLIFLMGTAPLLGWRKTSKELFYKSFRWPVAAFVVAAAAHFAFGRRIGFPAVVDVEPLYAGAVGHGLAWLVGKLPVVTVALVAYNTAVVIQEFQRGVSARQSKRDQTQEGIFLSLLRLVSKSRRRYGGYIVHVGISVMFLGFTGRAWESQKEISLSPGESVAIEEYELTYKGARTDVDHEKRQVFADLDVKRHGEFVGTISPHKNIYKASPMQPATEVARYWTFRNDLYVTVGVVNTQTKIASFRIHVNTLVILVWMGFGILLLGATISMWPEASLQEAGAFAYVRALGTTAMMVMLSLMLALYPSKAFGQQHEMRREGVVEQTPEERALFKQLLCDCGGCAHEALETCTCSWAHNARESVREQLANGKNTENIVTDYAAQHGSDAVIVQANTGFNRVLWILPFSLALIVGGLVVHRVIRWRRVGTAKKSGPTKTKRDEYDEKLDAELRAMDDEVL